MELAPVNVYFMCNLVIILYKGKMKKKSINNYEI